MPKPQAPQLSPEEREAREARRREKALEYEASMQAEYTATCRCPGTPGCDHPDGCQVRIPTPWHDGVFACVRCVWAFHDVLNTPIAEFVEPERRQSGTNEQTPESIERKRREQEALRHVKDCTSTFGLILDLKADRRWGTKWMRLSERQADAVLKHAEREAQWAAERAAAQTVREDEWRAVNRPQASGLDVRNLPVGPAFFAVTNDEGELTFLRLRRLAEDAKDRFSGQPYRWAGWTFVDQQVGPAFEKRGRIDPAGTYSGPWGSLVRKVMADPISAMAAYGHAIGRCGYCNSPLTNAESREYGIGPVCRGRLQGAAA